MIAYAFKTNAFIYCICSLKDRAYAVKKCIHIVKTLDIILRPTWMFMDRMIAPINVHSIS